MLRIWQAITGLFPFSREGRHTLLYLMISLCGPALTLLGWWAMETVRDFPDTTGTERLHLFGRLATISMGALFVIVIALSCFVSIRAIKIGRNGIEAEGRGGDD